MFYGFDVDQENLKKHGVELNVIGTFLTSSGGYDITISEFFVDLIRDTVEYKIAKNK